MTKLSAGAPARVAAGLAALTGVAMAILGGYLLLTGSGLPGAVSVSLVLLGSIQVVCAWFALQRTRVAWAFALSLNGTAFLIFLFGSPKLRDAASISIGGALVPSVVFLVVTLLYALSADEY